MAASIAAIGINECAVLRVTLSFRSNGEAKRSALREAAVFRHLREQRIDAARDEHFQDEIRRRAERHFHAAAHVAKRSRREIELERIALRHRGEYTAKLDHRQAVLERI